MTNILVINSSVSGEASVSRKLVEDFVGHVGGAAKVVRRDIAVDPIPHLTAGSVGAIRGGTAETGEARAALALADELVEELRAADLIVIGAPMYNFGLPSTLKAWFDHVLRARVTFRYTANGPEGLLTGKRAIVIESRAGVYSHGPAAAMDGQEPHLRTLLGFMGIKDVTFVRAEGLASDAEAAIARAAEEIRLLAEGELALAA